MLILEEQTIITVRIRGIVYVFDKSEGRLLKMKNKSVFRVSVTIPDKIEDISVCSLGCCFCIGPFSKVTIPNSVFIVDEGAFRGSNVEEVVWPPFCSTIPDQCFYGSHIKRISNIENSVFVIGASAFNSSDIEEFIWPKHCYVIPYACFYLSSIKSIKNIAHVTKVDQFSFSRCNIDKLEFPPCCPVISQYCFANSRLGEITNLDHIEVIKEKAFQGTCMTKPLDLSRLIGCNISEEAFEDFCLDEVILPYYL